VKRRPVTSPKPHISLLLLFLAAPDEFHFEHQRKQNIPMNAQGLQSRRQFVNFAFYKMAPEWRRLPLDEREEQRREFADAVRRWQVADTMKILTYSLVGLRADADFMLWRICYSLDCLQEMSSDLLHTRMSGYLTLTRSYLGMTRHSQYAIGDDSAVSHHLRGHIRVGGYKYLCVYPLVRTRNWYVLPFEERRRMVNELIKLSSDFPNTRLNVIYSFGLDEQDFVIAVETDSPDEYEERMMDARELDISPYTERDTPKTIGIRAPLGDMLERVG
jgi:chlorite dismutase